MEKRLDCLLIYCRKLGTKRTISVFSEFLFLFPGFIIHEISHILMIIFTLSAHKVTGYNFDFMELVVDDDVEFYRAYGLEISLESTLNPISGLLISTSPTIMIFIIFFAAGINITEHTILSLSIIVWLISLIDILAMSKGDQIALETNRRNLSALIIKMKRKFRL